MKAHAQYAATRQSVVFPNEPQFFLLLLVLGVCGFFAQVRLARSIPHTANATHTSSCSSSGCKEKQRHAVLLGFTLRYGISPI